MSYTVQAAEPNAGAAVRGVVTAGAQTFGGVKTFNNKIVVATQAGGNGLELAAGDYIGLGTYQLGAFGGMIYTPNADGFRTQGASGFWMGGINSAFNNAGLGASSQGNRVDISQGQNQSVSVLTNWGLAANVLTKIGTYQASPHASAELVRVGFGLGIGDGTNDGTAVLKVLGGNRIIAGAAASAPTDADLMNGSISFYLDEAGNNLKVRVKYSGGTLKTATIALV